MSEEKQEQTEEEHTTEFIYHLLENPFIKEQISQAIFSYGTLQEITAVKRQEERSLQADKKRITFEKETEQTLTTTAEQAAHDIPYAEVVDVRPYQYHFQSDRWYIEIDLEHHDPEEGTATALYYVWKQPEGGMTAMKVDIRKQRITRLAKHDRIRKKSP